MFDTIGRVRHQIRYRFWVGLGHPDQTLDDLIAKMEEIGNTIIEVDHENQRILCAEVSEHVWGCGVCLNEEGQLIIADSEQELRAHYAELHPGVWDA